MSAKRDLLFVSAGDRHRLHPSLAGPRDFDFVIAFYGEDAAVRSELRGLCDELLDTRGGKFQALQQWCPDPSRLERYDTVMVADDDVRLRSGQFEALFARRRELDVWVLSPAHSRAGKISFSALAARWAWDHHFTDFVELGTALFRSDCLRRFLEEFDGSLASYGIDFWYMHVFGKDALDRYAVDDRVVFVNPHSRPRSRGDEIDRLERRDRRIAAWERVSAERGIDPYVPEVTRRVVAPPRQQARQAVRAAWEHVTVLATQRGARRALGRRWGGRVVRGVLRRRTDSQQLSAPAS